MEPFLDHLVSLKTEDGVASFDLTTASFNRLTTPITEAVLVLVRDSIQVFATEEGPDGSASIFEWATDPGEGASLDQRRISYTHCLKWADVPARLLRRAPTPPHEVLAQTVLSRASHTRRELSLLEGSTLVQIIISEMLWSLMRHCLATLPRYCDHLPCIASDESCDDWHRVNTVLERSARHTRQSSLIRG